jgi:hypothetical protein
MGLTAYFPSEGRRAADFIALKIHRPRPGMNPRTLDPVASTLTTRPPRVTDYKLALPKYNTKHKMCRTRNQCNRKVGFMSCTQNLFSLKVVLTLYSLRN